MRLEDGSQVRGDRLLVAAGRKTDLAGLGVGAIGLDESARWIPVDGRMRAAPGVWAIGDVVGHGAFTHMSMYHAEIVIDDMLGRPYHPAEYDLSRATFQRRALRRPADLGFRGCGGSWLRTLRGRRGAGCRMCGR